MALRRLALGSQRIVAKPRGSGQTEAPNQGYTESLILRSAITARSHASAGSSYSGRETRISQADSDRFFDFCLTTFLPWGAVVAAREVGIMERVVPVALEGEQGAIDGCGVEQAV